MILSGREKKNARRNRNVAFFPVSFAYFRTQLPSSARSVCRIQSIYQMFSSRIQIGRCCHRDTLVRSFPKGRVVFTADDDNASFVTPVSNKQNRVSIISIVGVARVLENNNGENTMPYVVRVFGTNRTNDI